MDVEMLKGIDITALSCNASSYSSRISTEYCTERRAHHGYAGRRKQSPDAGMIAVIQRRAELLQRYLDLKAELLTEQGRIELAIHRMPEPWRIILAYRYLVGLSWRKIEDATHYSYPHLQRLHREALERLKGMG